LKELVSKIPVRKVLLYALYIFVVLLVQDMVLPQLRILGICPMILPAAAVALGMFGGPVWGTSYALVLGVFSDMAFRESVVMFTVMLPAMAFGVNFLVSFFVADRFVAYMILCAGALLAAGVVQMLLLVIREGFSYGMLRTVVLQSLWAMPPAVLEYYPLAKWFRV